ncbi:MAG TPA: hypothetical protein PLL66_03115 [Bacteroidales bacterium]|nr:hypothetical protein [Bacteroidales bacterium]
MKNLFCGVDISKDFLDYAICNGEDKSIIALEKIPNDRKGIKSLIKHLKKNQMEEVFGYALNTLVIMG